MIRNLLIATFLIGAILCSQWWPVRETHSHIPVDVTEDDLENVAITLRRSSHWGPGPSYRLSLNGNGLVVYEGESHVETQGLQTAFIPRDSVRALVEEFYKADFFAMLHRPWVPITDASVYECSIFLHGDTNSVTHNYLAPNNLLRLESRIDDIACSIQWIGEERFKWIVRSEDDLRRFGF